MSKLGEVFAIGNLVIFKNQVYRLWTSPTTNFNPLSASVALI